MLLTVNHGEGLQSSCNHGFQKSLTLEEVKIIISDLTHIPLKQLQLQRYLQGKVELACTVSILTQGILTLDDSCK